jgi:threonine synthase
MDQLICRDCKTTYAIDFPIWKCGCGGLLDIEFTPLFYLERIRSRPPTLWRYREALPLARDENRISLGEGFTPLVPVSFGGRNVLVKQDQLFATGSYKDRGAAVLISKVKELGIREVVEDSSGNAGCAVAAYCAAAEIACQIYVPESTALGKLAQIQYYGADLRRIPGSREDTARAVLAAAEHVYYASHSWNPFFFQGTKTWAFEVVEQLGWQAPDTVILPVGNGTLLLGAAIGFDELRQAGLIRDIPKMVGVQALACAPLALAAKEGLDYVPEIEQFDTLAEGIAIAAPVRGMQIIEAIKASGGEILTVGEAEIVESLHVMSRQGFYIEPTSAAVTAGVTQYLQKAPQDERIVTVFTGHGLKATEKMMKLAH